MRNYNGVEAGRKVHRGLTEIAKSLATLSAAAMIAAKAYAKKVEQELNPEPNTNWPS